MTSDKMKSYKQNGYAVFNEIYDSETLNSVKRRMSEIVQEIDLSNSSNKIAVFSTENSNKQLREDYFLDSAWQIKPFFESDAIDANGNLLVDKSIAFNKMGHNMHDLDPVFESLSYSKIVRTLLFKMMAF